MFLIQNSNLEEREIDDENDQQIMTSALEDLYYDLMKFEVEFEGQFEETLDDFERFLSGIVDEFLQALEVN